MEASINQNHIVGNNFSQSLFDLSFETNFDEPSFFKWMTSNWTQCFWYSLVYVTAIFIGKRVMKEKERFEIRVLLVLWSAGLAAFSILGALRTLPEMVYVIREHGWEYSMCSPSYFAGPVRFWAYMFTVSKVYELGDTLFIVLRKQPLIFLHYYHHISVLCYVWYSYTDHPGPGRWFMVMNYTVHAFMYSYYTLRAMKLRIPRFVNMILTMLQISQMVIGIVVNVHSYMVRIALDTKLTYTPYSSYVCVYI